MADTKLTPQERQELLRRYKNPVMTADTPAFGQAQEPAAFTEYVTSFNASPTFSRRAFDNMAEVTRKGRDPRPTIIEFDEYISPETKRQALRLNQDWAEWVKRNNHYGDNPYEPTWRIRDVGPNPVDNLREAIEADLAKNLPGYQDAIYGGYHGAHHTYTGMGPSPWGLDPLNERHTLNVSVKSEAPEHMAHSIREALRGHKDVTHGDNPQSYANRPGYRGDTYLKKARMGLEHLRETHPEQAKLIADLDAEVSMEESKYKPMQGPAEPPTEAYKRQMLYGE